MAHGVPLLQVADRGGDRSVHMPCRLVAMYARDVPRLPVPCFVFFRDPCACCLALERSRSTALTPNGVHLAPRAPCVPAPIYRLRMVHGLPQLRWHASGKRTRTANEPGDALAIVRVPVSGLSVPRLAHAASFIWAVGQGKRPLAREAKPQSQPRNHALRKARSQSHPRRTPSKLRVCRRRHCQQPRSPTLSRWRVVSTPMCVAVAGS